MSDLFQFAYPTFKFPTKKIRLFEAFSGIGTQSMAFKRLGVELDIVGISEIDKHAISAYEAIHGSVKNYGGIGTFDRLPKDIDVCTWSFPCQDISLAGTQSGMIDGSRSNYGYTFLETVENTPLNERPKILFMENVKALTSEKFKDDWLNIRLITERLGYTNYYQVLSATDYGIPQTRERIFMVSILGEYYYSFPEPFELTTRLSDYLEQNVDEKYYLSEQKLEQILSWKSQVRPLDQAKSKDDKVIQTITAKSNTSMNASMLLIKESTIQGYKEAEIGDGVYINRPHQKRGVVQKGKIQTIKTHNNDLGVVVPKNPQTINPKVNGKQPSLQDRVYDSNGVAITINRTWNANYLVDDLWVRKLTPREAWRLMGISDIDFEKAKAVVSDNQLYKQAGNAIVVDVLYHIFSKLF